MNVYSIGLSCDDSYKNHQMVKELFPGNGTVLFQSTGSKLIVVTSIALDSKFKDDLRIEKINFNLEIDEIIPFSIRLNSAKNYKVNGKRKRRGLHLDELDNWVDSKLSNVGAQILSREIRSEGTMMSLRKNKKCWHSSVLVFGTMKITDLNTFENVFENGIGYSKSFGFGMFNIF